MLFSFAVFTNLLPCVLCWVLEKCLVYEGYVNGVIVGQCPKSNLTGHCTGISNVTLDLVEMPPHVEVLCLSLMKDSSLHPYSFSRFQKLRTLKIIGSLSAVLPGAFKNLLSLQNLSIDCLGSLKFSLSSEVLNDVQNMTTLYLRNCRISSMAVDTFRGITNLDELIIANGLEDFSELLCRLTFVPSTLNYLSVTADNVVLGQPNCTFSNGTSFQVKFHGIEEVRLILSHTRVMYKRVLRYFPKISLLQINLSSFEVLKSELNQVDYLDLTFMRLNSFEEICEPAQKLLVTALTVTFFDITDNFVLNLDKCTQLEAFIMSVRYKQPTAINLTFINVFRNLTKLKVYWVVTAETKNRDGALALCENQSDLVTNLTLVILNTNNFKSISYKHFSCLRNLEELEWVNSKIEQIEDFTFNNTRLLNYLDLSSNEISQLRKYTFFGLSNLKTLLLNGNKLFVIEASTLVHLTAVEFVSLRVFQYPSSEPSAIQVNLSIPENVTNLYISSGMEPMTLILTGNGQKSHVGFSLHVFGQSVTFQDCDNEIFQSVTQLTAETDQLLCGQSFAGQFLKSLTDFTIIGNQKKAQVDLTNLNQMVNLKSLTLYNVDLSHQPGLNVIFHNLSKLEYLYMPYCSVPLLEKDLSRDLQSLKVLYLHINDVFSVMENFVEPLKNLHYLIIKQAFLHCNCDNAWITNWAKYQHSVQVYFPQSSLERLPCNTADETKNLQKYAQDYCFLDVDFLLFASTSLGLVFFMLTVLLHQLAGDYLLAFIHIAHAWVDEAMRANRKGHHYHFDAFVSYCGKDERWVIDELLPNLERRGPPFLRLCLHSRDFELGKDIVENITNSLYRSRHTLCLVSRNYLRSNWCSLEMRLATNRLLVEQRDVLVLVFLEKVPSQLLNVHHRLSRLVKTRTYIDWPQDPALHDAFWDRLWTKLAPKPAT